MCVCIYIYIYIYEYEVESWKERLRELAWTVKDLEEYLSADLCLRMCMCRDTCVCVYIYIYIYIYKQVYYMCTHACLHI